jgi:hypothetical protein
MLEANDGSRALVRISMCSVGRVLRLLLLIRLSQVTWTMQRRYVPLLQIGDLQIGRTIALSPLYCFIDFPRNERLYFEVCLVSLSLFLSLSATYTHLLFEQILMLTHRWTLNRSTTRHLTCSITCADLGRELFRLRRIYS